MYSPYIVSKSLRHQILTLNPNKNYNYQIEEIFYYGLENEEYKEYVANKPSLLSSKPAKAGLRREKKSSISKERRVLRTPKAPTAPRSKTEMKKNYGVTKISGADDLPPRKN